MTEAVDLAFHVAAVAGAVAFVGAGTAKLAAPASTASALRSLSAPTRAAVPTVVLLSATEITCGLLLALHPGPLAAVLVVVLAVSFALAGAVALTRDEPISCGCFGATASSHLLGWRQIAMLTVWIPLAVAVWRVSEVPPLVGLLLAHLVVLSVAARTAPALLRATARSRELRTMLEPVT